MEHFFAVIPNGAGYRIDWATKSEAGICYVPTGSCVPGTDRYFGIEMPLGEAVQIAQLLSKAGGEDSGVPIVVYPRSYHKGAIGC